MSSHFKKRIIYVFATIYSICIVAQSTQNPFELVDRLEAQNEVPSENIQITNDSSETSETATIIESSDTSVSESTKVISNSSNPFEITERPSKIDNSPTIEPSNNITSIPKEEKLKPTVKKITPAGKSTPHRGQFFIIMLITLLPITLLFTVFRDYFVKAFENIKNATILNRSYRDFAGASIIPMNLWYIVSWVNLGVFLSLVMNFYEVAFTKSPIMNVLICIGIVSGLHILKHFVLGFMAAVLPISKEVKLYAFLLLLFGIMIGVFLVPMNIAIIYAINQTTKLLIYGTLAIIAILYLVRAYRGLLVGGHLLALHKFHFLLYICVVELAPIFILIKLGLIYLGK